jgi:hypothetical protein
MPRRELDGQKTLQDIAIHARRRQRFPEERFVGPRSADDDPPNLIEDPAAIQLGQESSGRRRTLVPDHRRPGIVEDRAVLGDDRLEELEAVADAAQLEEGATRDENEPHPGLPGAVESLPYSRADPVVGGQGAVEIERQRLEEHVVWGGA